jgi:hypothetical protein
MSTLGENLGLAMAQIGPILHEAPLGHKPFLTNVGMPLAHQINAPASERLE